MGMGYGACQSIQIEQKNVEKICPETFKALMDFIEKHKELNLEAVAQCTKYDDWDCMDVIYEDEVEELKKVFEALTSDFEKKTEGVELYLSFHDSEAEGSLMVLSGA
jgi:hypothetical protein